MRTGKSVILHKGLGVRTGKSVILHKGLGVRTGKCYSAQRPGFVGLEVWVTGIM